MKKILLAMPIAALLLTGCSNKPEEQRVDPGMEQEAPIIPASEKDDLLDFEESDEEYQDAREIDAAAQPVIDEVRSDAQINKALEEAKSKAVEEE